MLLKELLIFVILSSFILLQGTNLHADDDSIMDVDDNTASFTGKWKTSRYRTLFYGDDYQYTRGAGVGKSPTATATFTTSQDADITGYYHVFVRWTAAYNRARRATFTIIDDLNNFLGTCVKDQRYNGGAWQFCDEVILNQNRKGRVVLGNGDERSNRFVIADGVRFVRVSKNNDDIVDQPGIDYSQTTAYYHPISTDLSVPTQLRSSTITCPASGYIAAHAKANAELFAGSSNAAVVPHVNISLNTTNTFNTEIQTWAGNRQGVGSTYNSHIGYLSMSLDWVWSCSSGQTITIFMTGFTAWSGDRTRILKPTLILNYFSSKY